MKRVIRSMSLLLCLALLVALFGACGGSEKPKEDGSHSSKAADVDHTTWQQPTEGSGGIALPIFKNAAQYGFMVYEVAAYPYKEGHIIIPELEKRANVKFDFQPTPVDGFPEKVNIMVMTNEYPDIIGGMDLPAIIEHGLSGNKFLNVLEYLDDMPNLKALVEKKPEFKHYKASADSMYALPVCLASEKSPISMMQYSYLVRKDLVDKHQLEIPGTFDELYGFLKKFKELYPESAPWSDRTGVGGLINKVAVSWGMNIQYDYIYDEQTGTFSFAYDNPRFKEIIEYLRKLYLEKLLDEELILMTTEQWMGKMITGASFFTNDWFSRAQVITEAARADGNNEFLMTAILPPVGPGGEQVVQSGSFARGFVAVSSKVKNPHEVMKMLDYFYYSKDGAVLTQLGVEGVSFRWVDDTKTKWEFIPYDDIPDFTDYNYYTDKFGIRIGMLTGVITEEYDIYQAGNVTDLYNWNVLKDHFISPPPPMLFTQEETERMQEMGSLGDYLTQETTKFIIGESDMSNWDAFMKQAEEYGSQEFVKIYNDSWGRRK